MTKNQTKKLLSYVLCGLASLWLFPATVNAAYPGGCHACRGPGSVCVEPGSGYRCGDASECGAVVGPTTDCPNNCTCIASVYVGGANSCLNKCIKVVSCDGSGPTPTPTPIPMGDIQGKIIKNNTATHCVGCGVCQGSTELDAHVRVSGEGGFFEANSCTAQGSIYKTTTDAGSHQVSIPNNKIPPNYFVGYTACVNDTSPSCHINSVVTQGSSVDVSVPDAGFVDLWWHFSSPGTIKIRSVASSKNCPDLLNESTGFQDGLSSLEISGLGNGTIVGDEKIYNDVMTDPDGIQYQLIGAGVAPIGFTPGFACWRKGDGTQGSGTWEYLQADETITWVVGFVPPDPWVQTAGGDVYAFNQVKSSLPDHAPNHKFNQKGVQDKPGVVIYGSGFDFDSDPAADGSNDVSPENWLASNKTGDEAVSLYNLFYTILGSPTTLDWNGGSYCGSLPCYATGPGPYVISSPLTIGANQKVVNLVNGDLQINSEIHVDNGGFLAFIVTGSITIADSVGTLAADSEDPQIEGVYVSDATFSTGNGNKKLVAEGMFIADSFQLGRDLESADNAEYPAELFMYGPRFIVSMPGEMAETLLRWQEVNP